MRIGLLAACSQVAGYRDVVARGKVRQQIELLKYEADGAPAQVGTAGIGEAGEILVHDADLTGRGRGEAADDVEQGGLARAGGADDGEELARLHGEIDSAQRRHIHLAHAVRLAQVLDFDHGRATHRTAPRWHRDWRHSNRDTASPRRRQPW
jgi:hypothetical protein